MRRLLPGFAGLVLLGGSVVACSSSSSSSPSDTTTTPPTSTAPAPTTTAVPTTTLPAEATGGASSTAEAAAQLVDAWRNRDLAAASRIADAIAVMGMFAIPDPDVWIRGCSIDDSLPEGGCIYRSETGLIQINTQHRDQGWVVSSAVFDRIDNGTQTHGDAPDAPPPTTVPPVTEPSATDVPVG